MFKNKTGKVKESFMDYIKMLDINSYEILGINNDATDSEIVLAYIGLIGQYNCDSNPSPDAIKKLLYIKLAYDLLTDSDSKMLHDYLLSYFKFKRRQAKKIKELEKNSTLYTESYITANMMVDKMIEAHYLLPFWLEYKKESFQINRTNKFDSKMKILY